MTTPEPDYRNIARRLVGSHQTPGGRDPLSSTTAFFQALESELQNLIGRVGLRAMEGRALRLAKSDYPMLESVQVAQNGNGLAAGLSQLREHSEPDDLEAAVVAVVGHMVGLLASLLGEEITLRLLRRTCPEVELDYEMLGEAPGGAE